MFERKPFSASSFVADQVKFGVSNIDVLQSALTENTLTESDLTKLVDAYATHMNLLLVRCFPRDSFDNLKALNLLHSSIEDQQLDLEAEWTDLCQRLHIEPTKAVTTEFAWKFFRKVDGNTFPEDTYQSLVNKLTVYIVQSIKQAHALHNADKLSKVIPAFKLLAYVHKMKEITHYECESEFDDLTRLGVDAEHLAFRVLTPTELAAAGEKSFQEASKVKK